MLINQSWTDEEYRNLEQMYLRRVVEAERITAMLGEISAHIGPVGSPAMLLKGMPAAYTWFPLSFFYDREGCAGMVFVAAVFEHRAIAQRFEACRKTLGAIAESHRGYDLADSDPAFEIIHHLDNNWWGRKPTICEAYPNDFAARLLARYPADVASNGPQMFVCEGKVFVRIEFRQYSDEEAVIFKDTAYLEDEDWQIVPNPLVKPFSTTNWLNQPESVRDRHGNQYWVNFSPATGG